MRVFKYRKSLVIHLRNIPRLEDLPPTEYEFPLGEPSYTSQNLGGLLVWAQLFANPGFATGMSPRIGGELLKRQTNGRMGFFKRIPGSSNRKQLTEYLPNNVLKLKKKSSLISNVSLSGSFAT